MKTQEHNQTADVEPESTRYTPGPWQITTENCGGGWNIHSGKAYIGHTCSYEKRPGSNERKLSPDEAKANGRLIAAAPDLLKACREARMALTLDYHGSTKPKKAICDISAAASQAYNALVLAIQKAEVRQ